MKVDGALKAVVASEEARQVSKFQEKLAERERKRQLKRTSSAASSSSIVSIDPLQESALYRSPLASLLAACRSAKLLPESSNNAAELCEQVSKLLGSGLNSAGSGEALKHLCRKAGFENASAEDLQSIHKDLFDEHGGVNLASMESLYNQALSGSVAKPLSTLATPKLDDGAPPISKEGRAGSGSKLAPLSDATADGEPGGTRFGGHGRRLSKPSGGGNEPAEHAPSHRKIPPPLSSPTKDRGGGVSPEPSVEEAIFRNLSIETEGPLLSAENSLVLADAAARAPGTYTGDFSHYSSPEPSPTLERAMAREPHFGAHSPRTPTSKPHHTHHTHHTHLHHPHSLPRHPHSPSLHAHLAPYAPHARRAEDDGGGAHDESSPWRGDRALSPREAARDLLNVDLETWLVKGSVEQITGRKRRPRLRKGEYGSPGSLHKGVGAVLADKYRQANRAALAKSPHPGESGAGRRLDRSTEMRSPVSKIEIGSAGAAMRESLDRLQRPGPGDSNLKALYSPPNPLRSVGGGIDEMGRRVAGGYSRELRQVVARAAGEEASAVAERVGLENSLLVMHFDAKLRQSAEERGRLLRQLEESVRLATFLRAQLEESAGRNRELEAQLAHAGRGAGGGGDEGGDGARGQEGERGGPVRRRRGAKEEEEEGEQEGIREVLEGVREELRKLGAEREGLREEAEQLRATNRQLEAERRELAAEKEAAEAAAEASREELRQLVAKKAARKADRHHHRGPAGGGGGNGALAQGRAPEESLQGDYDRDY